MATVNLLEAIRPGALAIACIFAMMALAVWNTLQSSTAPRRSTLLWTGGALAMASWLLLFSLREVLPGWVAYELAAGCFLSGALSRAMALRAHLGRPVEARSHLCALLVVLVIFSVLHRSGWSQGRVVFGFLMASLVTANVALWAWRCARRKKSRAARSLAWAEAQNSLFFGGFAVWQWAVRADFLNQPDRDLPTQIALVSLCITGVYTNLGYLGMVLEDLQLQRTQATEQSNQALLQAAQASAREEAAQDQAERLQTLVNEQKRLLSERGELLQLLAHEVRQPLHSASAVLQSLQLQGSTQPLSPSDLARRAARADKVLGQVRDVLDNVLVASQLLSRDAAPRLQPTDPVFLLNLTRLDLPDDLRQQVQLCCESLPDTVPLEPSLMRLLLRNLMRNALAHGGPQVQVQVLATPLPDALHWRLSVRDNGPGLPADRLHALQQYLLGSPGGQLTRDKQLGIGLGLQIVHKVASLHGARVQLQANAPQGLDVRLDLPLQAPAGQRPPSLPDTPSTPD